MQGQRPSVPVSSYIVVEANTKKIFDSFDPQKKLPVASLTKVATAVTVLDWVEATNTPLSTMVVVPASAHPTAVGGANPLGLQPGDRLSLRDALYAMLMASDNASAMAVADLVGRDLLRRTGRAADPIQHFVVQMNVLAHRLGMTRTLFTNPHGLDHYNGPQPYSTAADMARLALEATSRSSFLFYSSQANRVVNVQGQLGTRKLKVTNTNQLVGRQRIDGLKTGTTMAAGPCLILTADRPPKINQMPDGRTQVTPQRIVVVVLNAIDRFGLGNQLLNNGWRGYDSWYANGMGYTETTEFLNGLQ